MSGTDEDAHEGKIVIGEIATHGGPEDAGELRLEFVHYPGSQQLVMWLPKSGYQGYGELSVTRNGVDVERGPVRDRLNGSVQVLFYTLSWPPGDNRIVVTHADGWRHEATFAKYEPGQEPKPKPKPEAVDPHPPQRDASGRIIYRDGFGNVIPDVDLQMREQAGRDLAKRFMRRLEYEGTFRAGIITYVDADYRIRFSHEMCAAPMKFSIDLPTVEQWEKATGAPLSVRDWVIAFVAERVQKEQASSWRYRITDRSIDFY